MIETLSCLQFMRSSLNLHHCMRHSNLKFLVPAFLGSLCASKSYSKVQAYRYSTSTSAASKRKSRIFAFVVPH